MNCISTFVMLYDFCTFATGVCIVSCSLWFLLLLMMFGGVSEDRMQKLTFEPHSMSSFCILPNCSHAFSYSRRKFLIFLVKICIEQAVPLHVVSIACLRPRIFLHLEI